VVTGDGWDVVTDGNRGALVVPPASPHGDVDASDGLMLGDDGARRRGSRHGRLRKRRNSSEDVD
jgi:hypothetical protein